MRTDQADELERALAACSDRARHLFEVHAPASLERRPRPDAWSAADCLAHLTLTSAAFVPRFGNALRELRAAGRTTSQPSRMDWKGRLLRYSLEPRPWLRMKTTPSFEPVATGPVAGVLPAFLEQQDAIVRALQASVGLDLAAATIASPFNERLSYNVYSAFCILETHERRHLRQAEAAVVEAG